MTNKDIFKAAWKIAKEASREFNCSSKVFFSEALKEAHKMAKTHCRIKTKNWNFGFLDSFLTVTSPTGNSITITKDKTNNHASVSKLVNKIAKKSYVLLNSIEMQSLLTLSLQKF